MAYLLAALLVAVDQLSKAWVARNLPLNQVDVPVLPGLGITHTRNDGAAFGILRDLDVTVLSLHVDGTRMLGLLSGVVGVAIGAYLASQRRRLSVLQRLSLGLVMAGAFGNMIDRLRLGYVVDFIHVRSGWFSFPVFNVADACVVVGAGLLLLSGLRGPRPAEAAHAEPGVRDTSEEEEPYVHAARPAPAHLGQARERKRALDELPDLPPLRRAGEAE